MFRFLSHVCLVALLTVGLAGQSPAAISLSFDAADLDSGARPGAIDVDVVLNWSGTGANSLSSISFDVSTPTGVTLSDNPNPANPYNFNLASVLGNSVAFSNFPGFSDAVLAAGDNTLTTLSFNAANPGTFPIGLTLVQATGPNFVDIAQEVTATGGDLTVVPEPGSLGLVGTLLAGVCFRRRRRAS